MVSGGRINKTGYRRRADLIPAFLLVAEERNFPGKSCRKANNFQFDSRPEIKIKSLRSCYCRCFRVFVGGPHKAWANSPKTGSVFILRVRIQFKENEIDIFSVDVYVFLSFAESMIWSQLITKYYGWPNQQTQGVNIVLPNVFSILLRSDSRRFGIK